MSSTHTPLPAVRAIAVDVLGTLMDEPSALRSALREVAPHLTSDEVGRAAAQWQRSLSVEQERIARGIRPFADADLLDAEIAARLAAELGVTDEAATRVLARRNRMLEPWPDAVAGIARLAERVPVYALSNATVGTLDELAARTGLRWTGVLSATDARAYKPSSAVYRLVTDRTGLDAGDVLMIAAHAWDLRGARGIGMRTAYVSRPVGDPPAESDHFDGAFDGLIPLAAALT